MQSGQRTCESAHARTRQRRDRYRGRVFTSAAALGTEDRLAEHLAVRARETGMWVVGAQPSGRTRSFETGGMRGVWAPNGEAATRLGGEAPALASASIPPPA